MNQEDVAVKIIERSDINQINNFQSYEKDLVDFLIDDAIDNQEKNISVTYLFIHKNTNNIIGYLTVLTDTISLTPKLKQEFLAKNIKYKSLPALKIGRICVDDRYLKQGIGKSIVLLTYKLVYQINKIAGCRFITLDAKRNQDRSLDSLHFYKRMGFDILRERNKGTTSMYKDIGSILKAYAEEPSKKI